MQAVSETAGEKGCTGGSLVSALLHAVAVVASRWIHGMFGARAGWLDGARTLGDWLLGGWLGMASARGGWLGVACAVTVAIVALCRRACVVAVLADALVVLLGVVAMTVFVNDELDSVLVRGVAKVHWDLVVFVGVDVGGCVIAVWFEALLVSLGRGCQESEGDGKGKDSGVFHDGRGGTAKEGRATMEGWSRGEGGLGGGSRISR